MVEVPYPIDTSVFGVGVAIALLAVAAITAKRRYWRAAICFAGACAALAASGWGMLQGQWSPIPHYSMLGTALLILAILASGYSPIRRNTTHVHAGEAAWLFPASLAACLGALTMLLDVLAYHVQHPLPDILSVLTQITAIGVAGLAVMKGIEQWGELRRKRSSE